MRRSIMVRIVLSLLLSFGILAASPLPLFGQSVSLISAGSTWRYLDNGTNQGTAWRSSGFNDSTWASGPAQLGYGDGDEATLVGYGANAAAKYMTTYFRHTFSVTNPAAFGGLQLRVLRDDGAIVYVNGSEVFRTNMPAGTVGHTTPAAAPIGGTAETAFVSVALSPAVLVAGANVIAVEVHQSDPSSTDVSFDLELLGSASVGLTRGPYLQLGTPTSIVVRWRTSTPVVGRVQFGPSPGVVTGSAQESSVRTEHEVRLTGLLPDTVYYYSIGTPTTTIAGDAGFHFRTSPPLGSERPTRVWVLGDSGTADAGARAVRDAYANFAGSRYTDLWLMLGDNAYNNGLDQEYQAAVFNTYPAMLRKTVLWPTYGNHDGQASDSATQTGPYYDMFTLPKQGEAGGVASGTEAYYSFDYGNIHFVCLESFETNRSPTGPMLTWLQRDLAANTQPWVIVYFHHPPYSKGSHNSDVEIELVEMRQNALPILENFGVDLVLAGHSHAYERSFLIDGHYATSTTFTEAMKKGGGSGRPDGSGAYEKPAYRMAPHEGAVYVVAGVGGKLASGTLNHPAMYTSQVVLGSVVLDVQGNRLDATFLDSTGVRRDYFSIVKGAGGGAPPSTPAYGGTPAAIPGVFQAENFDEGGQSIAYSDATAHNSGGAYRTTAVDIATTNDTGGGYYVGWTRAGEWLKYTVNVGTAGTYSLHTRLAALGSGGRFHVEIDGVDRTGPITVPNTGAWDAWQTIPTPGIALGAGVRTVRVVFDAVAAGGSVAAFNWFQFVADSAPPPSTTPYGGTPAAIPGVVQAENFDNGAAGVAYVDTNTTNSGGAYRSTGVDIAPSTDPTGGGHYLGWTKAGEWLKYTVDVAASGTYTLQTRLASLGSGGRFHIEVDGVDRTGSIAVPDTGAWNNWQTLPTPNVALTAGQHVLRVVMEAVGSGNAVAGFNWFQFVGPTP
jgi:hypothetical protein